MTFWSVHFRFCNTCPQRNSEHHFLCCLCKEGGLEDEEDVHADKGSSHLAADSPTGPWCTTSRFLSPLPPWPTPCWGPNDLQPEVHRLSPQPRPAHSLCFVHKSYCKRAHSFLHRLQQWQSWTTVTKIVWPERPKNFALDPSKFADTHSRHLFSALFASPARTVGTACGHSCYLHQMCQREGRSPFSSTDTYHLGKSVLNLLNSPVSPQRANTPGKSTSTHVRFPLLKFQLCHSLTVWLWEMYSHLQPSLWELYNADTNTTTLTGLL